MNLRIGNVSYEHTVLAKLPPSIIHTYDFLQHFILGFVFPISTVFFSAVIAASLSHWLYRKLFARYATPEELLEDALKRLKKNERKKGRTSFPSSSSRERALQTIRLVISLQPNNVKPYTILATELFYGEINNASGENGQQRNISNNTALRRRRDTQTTHPQQHVSNNNLSPALLECQDLIKQGLSIDPKNESLLKLSNELQLVKQYGKDGAHTKMMNIGSFGWKSS